MEQVPFARLKEAVILKLKNGLSSQLSYHNIAHTLDVLEQSEIIAHLEGITDPEDLYLLKVGALYHDVGFLETYQGHEEKSCQIAIAELPAYGLFPAQIETICGLIRATQLPQAPKNLLEQIICDADLDYLGRSDFYQIGQGLYREFLWQSIVKDETQWNQVQVKFLENHQYFTASSRLRRQKQKEDRLFEIKAKIG